MLTPRGSGARRGRRTRRRRRLVAILVIVALLVTGGGIAGYLWWQGREPEQPSASPPSSSPTLVCHTPRPPKRPHTLPDPSTIEVSVLNGSSQSGLALTTADALAKVGFSVIGFGNSSHGPATAAVHYAKKQLAEAIVLASYLPGSVLISRTGGGTTTLVAVLGDGFTKVRTAAGATAAAPTVPIPTPSPICS